MRNTKLTKSEVKEQVGSNFSLALVDKEEISASDIIFPICNICGRIFSTNRRKLAKLNRCPTCSYTKRAEIKSKKFDEFEKEAIIKHKNKYTYFKDFYKNASTDTLIRCNWCHNVFWQEPRNHLNGQGCQFCSLKKRTEELRKPEEQVIENIKTNLDGRFTFIKLNNKYINNKISKATVRCNICNKDYTANVNVLEYRDVVCTNCANNFNIAEERCKVYLHNLGINDIRGEVRFKDLIYKNNLRFDIFLPDYMMAIEIQGYHHYKPYKYSEKEQDEVNKFKLQQIKDQLKRDWCKKHNVLLIEIPYYKVRRESGVKNVFKQINFEKTEYTLKELECDYNKFVLTDELKTIFKVH